MNIIGAIPSVGIELGMMIRFYNNEVFQMFYSQHLNVVRLCKILFRIPLLLLLFLLTPSNSFASSSKVVVLLPLSGAYSDIGIEMRNSIELSKELFTTPKLPIMIVDTHSNADSAKRFAQIYADDPEVIALAGGYPSSIAIEVYHIALSTGIPYIIIASSKDTLTQTPNRNVFRLIPPTSDFNDGLISWIVTVVGTEKPIGVLYEKHPDLKQPLLDVQRDLEMKWRGNVEFRSFESGEDDFFAIIEELKSINVGFLYLITSERATISILTHCKEANYLPFGIALGNLQPSRQSVIHLYGESISNYLFAPSLWNPHIPTMQIKQFVSEYQNRYLKLPSYHSAIAASLPQILSAVNAHQKSREELIDELSSINTMTVVGQVRFENYGTYFNQNKMRSFTVQYLSGEWRVIWPPDIAETRFTYPVPSWSMREYIPPYSRPNFLLISAIVLALIVIFLTIAVRVREAKKQKG